MKKLYIARHAKSDWPVGVLTDFDRPLNERGRNDAALMSNFLRSNRLIPDMILASPAVRALTTARIMASEPSGNVKTPLITVDMLYMTDVWHTLKVISTIDDALRSAMIVGHNPTQTLLVNYLTNEMIDSVPTCGIVIAEFPQADSWQEISRSTGVLTAFYTPNNFNK
ncbi:histidine phosphatase family protein [Ignavibacteria bacterium]|jgi:phosphohistidine phosphatase|nr:histidine phosphatase family protein [Bacteroidota bacterium]MCZ2131748.1 histidine phosphatase family protein [Bacteroidota bacterium]